MAERAQRAANRKNTCKLRKQLHQFYNTCTANAPNTTKQRKALQIKFFIRLCCEHLQHMLSNWWRCFLDLLVLFLFACVFWSCSTLSSLGHRRVLPLKHHKMWYFFFLLKRRGCPWWIRMGKAESTFRRQNHHSFPNIKGLYGNHICSVT